MNVLEKKLKKVKPLVVGLLMLGSMMVFTYVFTEEVRAATTWIVDNQNTPRDFTTIRAALLDGRVSAGDTIQVNYGSGTYSENNPLTISKSLYIIGMLSGSALPTVTAQNSNMDLFRIIGSGYPSVIEQFTITGSTATGKAGVYSSVAATSGNEAAINYCVITGNNIGVLLASGSSYNIIESCTITDNADDGINLQGSHHTIDDCGSTFQTSTGIYQNGGNGVYGYGVTYSIITDSSIWDNDENGINIVYSSNYNSIEEVEVWENGERGILLSGNGNEIDGLGSRNIKDNNVGGSGTLYDVSINGNDNTLIDYEIYQDPPVTGDEWNGVFTANTNYQYPNIIQDCQVHGYEGEDAIGIILGGGDDIKGIDTEVYECNIGVKAGSASYNSEIDCDNTAYTSGSENFYNNVIGVMVNCENCVIKESYFYITGSSVSGVTGILIDNTYGKIYADIDDCKIQKMWTGIEIIDSNNNDHSFIDGCNISTSGYYGIYIDGSNNGAGYDDITDCEIYGSTYYGIYLYSGYDIDITYCEFEYNHFTGTGFKGCGFYAEGSSYIDIEYCDFINHYCAIWFDDHSCYNNIKYCYIDDYSTSGIGEYGDWWGTHNREVGILFSDLSNTNLVQEVDIYKVGYGIGIEGCYEGDTDGAIQIYGDTSSDSIMNNIKYYPLYATKYGDYSSSGRIRDYNSNIAKVFLLGLDDLDTIFTFDSLSQTWDVDEDGGSKYYNWTAEV